MVVISSDSSVIIVPNFVYMSFLKRIRNSFPYVLQQKSPWFSLGWRCSGIYSSFLLSCLCMLIIIQLNQFHGYWSTIKRMYIFIHQCWQCHSWKQYSQIVLTIQKSINRFKQSIIKPSIECKFPVLYSYFWLYVF